MLAQTPLLQIIALIVGLLVGSLLPIPALGLVLAEIRLLLVMVLGVAVLYYGLLQREQELQHEPLAAAIEPLKELERGS